MQRDHVRRITHFEKGHRMKMYPDDWRVRITTAVGGGVGMAAAMMLGPVVGIEGLLPGGLAIIVGIVLGGLVGRLLFQLSSVRPLDHPPHA